MTGPTVQEQVAVFVNEVLTTYYDQMWQWKEALVAANGGKPPCSIEGCHEPAVLQLQPAAGVFLPWPPCWFCCATHTPTHESPWPLEATPGDVDMDRQVVRWGPKEWREERNEQKVRSGDAARRDRGTVPGVDEPVPGDS